MNRLRLNFFCQSHEKFSWGFLYRAPPKLGRQCGRDRQRDEAPRGKAHNADLGDWISDSDGD